MNRRVLLSWSSGKDSAWTLHVLRQQAGTDVVALLTTITESDARVPMHDVPHALVAAQARAAGLPLWTVPLPWPCANREYEARIAPAMQRAVNEGITHIAFGDLFLDDIRDYRVRQLAAYAIEPLFPIWHEPTAALARQMIDAGVRAIVTCADKSRLTNAFVGCAFDHAFLDRLPENVDPCGENGEFHTFVTHAPSLGSMVRVRSGNAIERDGYYFAPLSLRL